MDRTLWWATADVPPPTSPLRGTQSVDVAIVGAGFTGLTAAIHLARRGVRVAVLEADCIGSGASGVNAGFVVPHLSRSDPAAVLARLGREHGARLLKLVGAGGDRVFATAREFGISCDAAQTGWLQPALTEETADLLRARTETWSALGRPVSFVDADMTARLTGVEIYRGALLDRSGGTIHPLNYVRGLARAALRLGAAIHEQSPVLSVEREGGGWRLSTGSASLLADRVLLCTNASTGGIAARLGRAVVPLTVYQAATAPVPADIVRRVSRERMPVSDARANLFTYRLDRDDRLISGGMSVVPLYAHARVGQRIVRRLVQELGLPSVPVVDFVWRGRAAMTPDGLPHIYELAPGFFGGIGCNGRGVAMTAMLGEVLADAATGARPDDLPIPLSPGRAIPFHALSPIAASAALIRARLQDWRAGAE